MEYDHKKSLQQLDGQYWGEPTFHSHLVTECHRLREIPLCDFTIENLRIMIGQNFSLEYLIPIALERLRDNPMAAGDYYEGDLLLNVLRSEPNFWIGHCDLHKYAADIADRAILLMADNPDLVTDGTARAVQEAIEIFTGRNKS